MRQKTYLNNIFAILWIHKYPATSASGITRCKGDVQVCALRVGLGNKMSWDIKGKDSIKIIQTSRFKIFWRIFINIYKMYKGVHFLETLSIVATQKRVFSPCQQVSENFHDLQQAYFHQRVPSSQCQPMPNSLLPAKLRGYVSSYLPQFIQTLSRKSYSPHVQHQCSQGSKHVNFSVCKR